MNYYLKTNRKSAISLSCFKIWTLIFRSYTRNKLNCLNQPAKYFLVLRKISLEGKI